MPIKTANEVLSKMWATEEDIPLIQAIDHFLAIYPRLDDRGQRIDAAGILYVLFRSYDDRVEGMMGIVPLSVNYADPQQLAPFMVAMHQTGRKLLQAHAEAIFPQVRGHIYRA